MKNGGEILTMLSKEGGEVRSTGTRSYANAERKGQKTFRREAQSCMFDDDKAARFNGGGGGGAFLPIRDTGGGGGFLAEPA